MAVATAETLAYWKVALKAGQMVALKASKMAAEMVDWLAEMMAYKQVALKADKTVARKVVMTDESRAVEMVGWLVVM